jgi:hypothetical protein
MTNGHVRERTNLSMRITNGIYIPPTKELCTAVVNLARYVQWNKKWAAHAPGALFFNNEAQSRGFHFESHRAAYTWQSVEHCGVLTDMGLFSALYWPESSC